MTISRAEAKRLLVSMLPDGADQHYDLDGDIGKIVYALGGGAKAMFDACENLLLELDPATATEKIPDWEAALGLSQTRIANFGTIQQRRNQVLAYLRNYNAGFSLDEIRAAVQPFLLYAVPGQIQILETDRAALTTLHTYAASGTPLVLGGSSSGSIAFSVPDDGDVTEAGVHLTVNLTGTIDQLTFILLGPQGWPQVGMFLPGHLGSGAVVATSYTVYAPRDRIFYSGAVGFTIAGKVGGTWLLLIATGAAGATIHSASIFVEGIGLDASGNAGLGAAMYEFAVVVDPALLGGGFLGGNSDVDAAREVLQRLRPAHLKASLVTKNSVVGGGLMAIPDDPATIPDACVPGT